MKRIAFVAVAVVALSGCTKSVDELRSEPVRFSVTVAAPWDRLATCIKERYVDKYSVVDLPVAHEHRTEVLIQQMGSFDVRATPAGTAVVLRRRDMLAGDQSFDATAREAIERCR